MSLDNLRSSGGYCLRRFLAVGIRGFAGRIRESHDAAPGRARDALDPRSEAGPGLFCFGEAPVQAGTARLGSTGNGISGEQPGHPPSACRAGRDSSPAPGIPSAMASREKRSRRQPTSAGTRAGPGSPRAERSPGRGGCGPLFERKECGECPDQPRPGRTRQQRSPPPAGGEVPPPRPLPRERHPWHPRSSTSKSPPAPMNSS